MIHGPVKRVGGAVAIRGRRLGYQGITGRSTDSLSDAVGEADKENEGPRPGESDEGAEKRGYPVAGQNERLSRGEAVRDDTGEDLEQARRRLGNPFDQTEYHG